MKLLKQHLKERAALLRHLKQQRFVRPYGYVQELYGERLSYRAHHIAYALMRKMPIEVVENYRINNPPDPDSFTERLLQRQIADVLKRFAVAEVVHA